MSEQTRADLMTDMAIEQRERAERAEAENVRLRARVARLEAAVTATVYVLDRFAIWQDDDDTQGLRYQAMQEAKDLRAALGEGLRVVLEERHGELEVRLTSRLMTTLGNSIRGALVSFIADHGHSLSNGHIESAVKRVRGMVWAIMRDHPDIRRRVGKYEDELRAALASSEGECSAKAKALNRLGAELEAAEAEKASLRARVARLEAVLRQTRPYIVSAQSGEHLMDGFGPRSSQPSDGVLTELDAALMVDETEPYRSGCTCGGQDGAHAEECPVPDYMARLKGEQSDDRAGCSESITPHDAAHLALTRKTDAP